MMMKKRLIALSVLGSLLALSACSRQNHRLSAALIGTWESAPQDSELGRIVQIVTFHQTGQCDWEIADADPELREDRLEESGAWRTRGDALVLQLQKKDGTSSVFAVGLTNDTLTLSIENETLTFKRNGSAQPQD